MAVSMSLKSMGAKKKPFYRVVVADSSYPSDGSFIEEMGYYDPLVDSDGIKLNIESTKHWMSLGAKPTDTVFSILKKEAMI